MRYAVINQKNEVANVVLWDGKAPWSPPRGHYVIASEEARIGDHYDIATEKFTVSINSQ